MFTHDNHIHNIDKRGQQAASDQSVLPLFRADETWPERVQAWFYSLKKACMSSPLAACLREWLWDWFILVHHLPHQSFTWDCEDDKSESLMWSKVSGSESVWVNTKGLLFPFFFNPSSPSRPRHPLPLSLSPSPLHHHSPFSRYITAMCGSSRVCELGARPHLRRCAEGADCTVTSFSLCLSLSIRLLLSLLVRWLFSSAASSCSHMLPTSAFPILLTGYCVADCVGGSVHSPPTDLIRVIKKKNGKMEGWERKKVRLHLAFWIQTHVRCCKWQKDWTARRHWLVSSSRCSLIWKWKPRWKLLQLNAFHILHVGS